MAGRPLDIAYLHYGAQSGVTSQMTQGLRARGHHVHPLMVPGPLELRDRAGRRRLSLKISRHLAAALKQFGRHALGHRWNTAYAFDVHTRQAAHLVARLPRTPDVLLQNGALFSPGAGDPPYALLLDHTHALSMRSPLPELRAAPPVLDYGPAWQRREESLYRGARVTGTMSRHAAESVVRDYGVPPDRVHVVGGGANIFPRQVEHHDDGRTLLFVGKDFERKGGMVLLRAFERLRRVRPGLRLLLAGSRPQSLPAGVRHLGVVPVDHLASVFAQATLFVLPTLREPYGIAFLDAMACGLPCIGTNIEAVPEIIEEGLTGLLVPPGDDVALTGAAAALLNDPGRARAMGERGRRRVAQQFLWSHVAARVERMLLAAAGVSDEQLSRASGL